MFYIKQSNSAKTHYKRLLNGALSIGSIIRPKSKNVHLQYELSEQIFCRSFDAENIAGLDLSIDAKKDLDGIGIKTFTGAKLQKIAEFNDNTKYQFSSDDNRTIKQICSYRNNRLNKDIKELSLRNLIYHLIVRRNGSQIEICEIDMVKIQHEYLEQLPSNKSHIVKFTDNLHSYSFNRTKSTLYMNFIDLTVCDIHSFSYDIDDVTYLKNEIVDYPVNKKVIHKVVLPLFSERTNDVQLKSGLNQWRADGRPRHHDEVYIPIPRRIHNENHGFFPARNTVFRLKTKDNQTMIGKVCQENDKALMSNPNRDLGKWILRDKLKLEKQIAVTKEILKQRKIDSITVEKIDDKNFVIDTGYNFFN